jgi:hypothetical protein
MSDIPPIPPVPKLSTVSVESAASSVLAPQGEGMGKKLPSIADRMAVRAAREALRSRKSDLE